MTKPNLAHVRPAVRDGFNEEARQTLQILRACRQTVNVVLVALSDGVELEVWADGSLRRRSRFLRDTEARKYSDRLTARLARRGAHRRRRGPVTRARSQPLVLLAEDFEDARELYRDYLEFSGFTVQTASNGREAIDQAIALLPDVILMDASMPVLDGWQATKALKANPATKHIPILALTAHAFEDARQEARAAGCDGFVTKPCLPDDLVARVRATLDGDKNDTKKKKR